MKLGGGSENFWVDEHMEVLEECHPRESHPGESVGAQCPFSHTLSYICISSIWLLLSYAPL